MRTVSRIVRYQVRNALRGPVVVAYGGLFALATLGLLRMGGGVERALPSLANLTLLAVPLVTLVVTTISLYDGRAFTELLLSHPVGRRALFRGLYLGLTIPLILVFLVGVGAPLAAAGAFATASTSTVLLLAAGVLLTAVFGALGCLVALSFQEAARGLAVALVLWLALTLVYDGIVLAASHALAAWPLERPMLAFMLLNPVDLARVLILMAVDASALLGYTGAVFQDFFGSGVGVAAAMLSLAFWVGLPYTLAMRRFRRMDF